MLIVDKPAFPDCRAFESRIHNDKYNIETVAAKAGVLPECLRHAAAYDYKLRDGKFKRRIAKKSGRKEVCEICLKMLNRICALFLLQRDEILLKLAKMKTNQLIQCTINPKKFKYRFIERLPATDVCGIIRREG